MANRIRKDYRDDELNPTSLSIRALCERPLLTRDEEISLFWQLKAASTESEKKAIAEEIILSNTRMVIGQAKKHTGRGVQFFDLVHEGILGLARAVDLFEPERGLKFSTYATWWIRQAVSRAVIEQGRTIRLPVHKSDQITKLLKIINEFEQANGYKPTRKEQAILMELTVDKIIELHRQSRHVESLEEKLFEDKKDSDTLGDFIEDDRAIDPGESVDLSLLQERMEQALETLTPREARILQKRFGLVDGETHTLEEVGQMFGITRERIRQLEAQALKKLRHPRRARQLREFLEV